MPYMYSEMQNKLSKTRESPLESMGQIISSRCPSVSGVIPVPVDKINKMAESGAPRLGVNEVVFCWISSIIFAL